MARSLLKILTALLLVMVSPHTFASQGGVPCLVGNESSDPPGHGNPPRALSPSRVSNRPDSIGPVLFFTDITSGPTSGGQDDLGAFIAIYGEGFGAARGTSTVTIGGTEVAKYVIWGQDNAVARDLDMIVVQPGPNVASGDVVVTVNGSASNPLPFAVRGGSIYFVIPGAPNAADANPGTYAEPFKTLYRPRHVMQAGDIVYVKGGTYGAADPDYPGWDAILLLEPTISPNGTPDHPIAYIGYPGDRPVLGAPAPMRRGIYMEQTIAHYVIANWEFSQYAGSLNLSGNGHRIVGNYAHDGVAGEDYTVMGVAGNSAQLRVFGNLLRNNPNLGGDEVGVGFYLEGFGTNRDVDFGWNEIRDQDGRRSIQVFGHVAGDRMEDIRIHDNLIWTSRPLRNNILLGGSDGGTDVLGTFYVYNNIIVGADGQGLRINDPQGTVIIQNNVLYDNGSSGYDGNGQIFIEQAGAGRITLQDNILYATAGETYYDLGQGVGPSVFSAARNNLVYNAGACPAWDTGCVNADPTFVSLLAGDFRLQAQSPAIDAGVNTGITTDYGGVSRPQGAAYDIGAHEYSGSCLAIILAPASLPNGTLGTAYSQTISASGGAGAYTYLLTAGGLPTGLSLSSGGVLSGTPTSADTFDFSVTATDANSCRGSRNYRITITSTACTLTCTATVPSSGTAGTPVGFQSAVATTPPGCAVPSYDWNFGDGSAHSTEQNPSHTYAAGGSYTWTLTASGSPASPCSESGTVAVTGAQPPVITSVVKRTGPFRLVITGTGIKNPCTVRVGGTGVPSTVYKDPTRAVAKGGSALKALLPKSVTVEITLTNDDDGVPSSPYSFTR